MLLTFVEPPQRSCVTTLPITGEFIFFPSKTVDHFDTGTEPGYGDRGLSLETKIVVSPRRSNFWIFLKRSLGATRQTDRDSRKGSRTWLKIYQTDFAKFSNWGLGPSLSYWICKLVRDKAGEVQILGAFGPQRIEVVAVWAIRALKFKTCRAGRPQKCGNFPTSRIISMFSVGKTRKVLKKIVVTVLIPEFPLSAKLCPRTCWSPFASHSDRKEERTAEKQCPGYLVNPIHKYFPNFSAPVKL